MLAGYVIDVMVAGKTAVSHCAGIEAAMTGAANSVNIKKTANKAIALKSLFGIF
jgi:hypothetical protein